jgi:hypothetical protein
MRRKLIIEVKNHKKASVKVSDLTVDEARAMAADVTARLAALLQRWEETGDLQALLGALIFCEPLLPERLFKALRQNLEQQFKDPDEQRFLAVRHARDDLGKTIDESYDWASKNVTPDASGRRDTMMKSYQKINRLVAEINRIRPRPRSPRRRG